LANSSYNVLFLCTGNSARSIIAEKVLDKLGRGRFRGFSAGSRPVGTVHELAIQTLRRNNFPTGGLRSKDWSEFTAPGAPAMDFVITVCDSAAAEECPLWPGRPVSAHWGIPDPAKAVGDEMSRRMAFRQTLCNLERRISLFVGLPIESNDAPSLQQRLDDIGMTSIHAT